MIDIETLKNQAIRSGCWLPPGFADVSASELDYNGIGPEYWQPWMRKILTFLLKFMQEAAMIHDYEFSLGGSYWKFTIANIRLLLNGLKAAKKAKRPTAYFCAVAAAVLCQIFGGKAWKGTKK